jgi:hypothetical protein
VVLSSSAVDQRSPVGGPSGFEEVGGWGKE